jgi:hypothetical protein
MSKIICLGIIIICTFGFAQERVIANTQLSRLETKIAQLENQITELKKLLQKNEITKKSADFTPESRLWLEGTMGWTQTGDSLYPNTGTANVGIGTSSPTQRLDINGAIKIGANVEIADSTGAIRWDGSHFEGYNGFAWVALDIDSTAADNDWVISGNNMYSAVPGSVGVGVVSPAEKLDVDGAVNVSSVYKIGGNRVLSNAGTNNIFVGVGAGENNTTGSWNTFLGDQVGYSNSTGYYNTFLGHAAGYKNTEGFENTFSGLAAGWANTTGWGNTFSGYEAGYSNTTGYSNTFSGRRAGYKNTTGGGNTFSGYQAGYQNTSGSYNTFSGWHAGQLNTTGSENTFSGCGVGNSNTTGNYNTFSGSHAGHLNTEGAGNVFLGYQAGYNETGSNKLYIANGQNDANVLIYGEFDNRRVGIGTTSPTANLDVGGSTGYNQIRMRTSYAPTGTGDTNGNIGDIAWGDNYIYIKTSAGWKRAALSTW